MRPFETTTEQLERVTRERDALLAAAKQAYKCSHSPTVEGILLDAIKAIEPAWEMEGA